MPKDKYLERMINRMKKVLSVLVALTMCLCLCLPAFAAEDLLGSAAGGIGDMASGILGDLNMDEILGTVPGLFPEDLLGTITGLIGGVGGSEGESEGGLGDILGGFDPTGALSSFVESLDLSQITDLFSGLLGSLGSEGISLEGITGLFDISSILGGNSGSGAGVAGIMDTFGGVLETLGLDSSVIEGLLDNDIINFFANLYLGSVKPVEEPTEPAPTEPSTTEPYNPPMGVNDSAAVIVACATLSVAAAAAFVCTKKKHA